MQEVIEELKNALEHLERAEDALVRERRGRRVFLAKPYYLILNARDRMRDALKMLKKEEPCNKP